MKSVLRTAILLLCLLLTLSACLCGCAPQRSSRYFSGDALTYYHALCAQGFPADYAEELTELHLLHPTWQFIPLQITSTNKDYTWEYVIGKETEKPDINLISPSNIYQAYRHASNTSTYDSGYYQASREAVAYFMDPRNFLNETDIFQFFDLSSTSTNCLQAIEAVLAGTFMEGVRLENGKTYAENFEEIGNAVGVHPVYLAVKVYQEQGAKGNSPLVSGDCGDVLWDFYRNNTQYTSGGAQVLPPDQADRNELLALNGYYNLMNVGASGNGLFAIYQNAAEYAREGSEEMREAWGGNASWNTRWKSIWGGALLLRSRYIDRYQSTMYLQKFNVDGRSDRNFWGQYMQNVAGALIEARSLYQSFAGVGALDAPCTFLIPVYAQMPARASADPANGACSYLRSTDRKYDYVTALRNPVQTRVESEPLYLDHTLQRGETLCINGLISHDYGIRHIEYSLNGGAWQSVGESERFNFEISPADLADDTHILIIRGIADYDGEDADQKSNSHFLCAVLYLTVEDRSP